MSTDTITTKSAKINNFLKIPVSNSSLNSTPGSIFFNTSSNLYENFQ